jgi:hypothetical protein
MKRFLFMLAAVSFFAQFVFSQQQVVLNAAKDNTLYQTIDGSLSNGSGDFLFVGRVGGTGGGSIRRSLVKFDLAGSVPSSATITSVKLTMNMSKTTAGPQRDRKSTRLNSSHHG